VGSFRTGALALESGITEEARSAAVETLTQEGHAQGKVVITM
jgi:hypothetical protein